MHDARTPRVPTTGRALSPYFALLLASSALAQQPLDAPLELLERDLSPGPVVSRAPGTDTSLCMNWEPTIAVDPNDPRIVAVSQFTSIQVSYDGGQTFTTTVTAPAVNPNGDPSLAFDSRGRLFLTYLCRPGAGRDVCISGYSIDPVAGTTTLLPGAWPVNVSVAAGVGGVNADKEWLAADSSAASPFRDRLQVVWIRLDTNPWSVWHSTSSDQGQTWSAGQQLSAADEGTAWPCHVAVGPGGVVYAAWHGQPGFLDAPSNDLPDGVSGRIALRRSDDGGATWQPRSFPYGPGNADMTYNVQHEASGQIPGHAAWLPGSLQPWILPDPLVAGRVHVVQNDDPDNVFDGGDAADVFIVTSADLGASWGARRRVDQGPAGTFQILPTAAINPVNGAIGVAWYDNRALADANLDGIFELDLLATSSTDGGITWTPEVDVNDGRMDPARANTCRFCGSDGVTNQPCGTMACPNPGTGRIGEYNGIAFGECTLHFVWADDATCGGDYDTFYDRDPNLGGDVAPPVLACPPDATVACGAPTTPAATGTATALDACDLDPAVSFNDVVEPGNCPPGDIVQRIRRRWTAVDAAGNSTSCEQLILTIDMEAPDVAAPAPLVLECNGAGGVPASDPQVVAWLADAAASDDCSAPTLSNDAPALIPAGCPPDGTVTTVTFTAEDACGNVGESSSTLTVIDTTAPVVSAPAPLVLECNSPGGVLATDPQVVAWLALASATDACSTPTLSHDAPALFPFGCPPAGTVTNVTFTAVDACGNAGQASSSVAVVDTTPPSVSATVALDTLWPPNHALVDVGLAVVASDACSPDAPLISVGVSSDEHPAHEPGAGGPAHCPDAVVTAGQGVLVRAERSGAGDGRVVRIVVTATDSCGNAAQAEAFVSVPSSQGAKGAAVDSGQVHDATACD